MTESSDSDIIQRKKPKIQRSIHYSEDSSSSSMTEDSNIAESRFDPLFYEIFGNGDEYNYIYQTKEEQIEIAPQVKNIELIPSECYAYINKFTRGFSTLFKDLDQAIVRNLIDGCSPEYLAFHTNKMTVKELYFIKDLIEEFSEFLQFSAKDDKVDSLLSSKIKRQTENENKIEGFMKISEFVQNMLSFESVFYPNGSISVSFDIKSSEKQADDDNWGFEETNTAKEKFNFSSSDKELIEKYFSKMISMIASNPVFIDRVNKAYIVKELEPDHCQTSVHSLQFLQKMFCSGYDDLDDEIRRLIVERAFQSVNIEIESIKKKLINQGMIDGPNGLQELVNLILSLRGKPGSYAGVFFDKSLFSVVKIDEFGNFVESAVFKESEIEDLKSFLLCVENVCLTSTSPMVKYAFMNAGIDFLYVPKRLSFFDDFKELSVPYNIALLIHNPVIYFSRLWYFLKNQYPISNFRSNDVEMLAKAVLISLSTIRLDLKDTIKHKFGFTLFKLLQINIFESYFDFEKLSRLEDLKQIFDQAKFNNICTYFNLKSSRNPLERTLIHPVNFSMAKVFFKGQYHSLLNSRNDAVMNHHQILDLEKDEDKIVEMFVEKPSLLSNCSEFYEYDNDLMFFNVLKYIMLRPGEVFFSGATDIQIFEDVVPDLSQDKIHTATVTKVGADFYLCQTSNSATIFVKKKGEYNINQVVKIKIIDKTPYTLSYVGEIVEEQAVSVEKFKTHRYFKNMDYKTLEIFMNKNDKKIQIRPSSTPECCVVVCKIESDLFFSFKLKETCQDGNVIYEYRDKMFSTIDLFIDEYLKKMYRIIQSIVSFKYYFDSFDKAKEHLETPGEFIKYCVILSRENPGYLEFLIGEKRIFAKIEGDQLILKEYAFRSFEEFVSFVKTHIKVI